MRYTIVIMHVLKFATALGGLALLSCGSVPPVEVEAENFSRGDVTVDKQTYGKGIGVIVTLKPQAYVEYDLDLPKSGNCEIELRYASAAPRPLRLIIDGRVVNPHAADQETGGFLPENQKWVPAGSASLASGRHTLRLESDSVFPHIDKIRLKRIAFKIGG